MSSLTYIFLFAAVLLVADRTYGISEETKKAMKEKAAPLMLECADELHLDASAMAEMEKIKDVTKENSCLMSCVYKKQGLIDAKGMVDEEKSLAKAHILAESEEEEEKIKAAIKTCSQVNSEPVSDGDEGCERVLLMKICLRVQAEKLGYKY